MGRESKRCCSLKCNHLMYKHISPNMTHLTYRRERWKKVKGRRRLWVWFLVQWTVCVVCVLLATLAPPSSPKTFMRVKDIMHFTTCASAAGCWLRQRSNWNGHQWQMRLILQLASFVVLDSAVRLVRQWIPHRLPAAATHVDPRWGMVLSPLPTCKLYGKMKNEKWWTDHRILTFLEIFWRGKIVCKAFYQWSWIKTNQPESLLSSFSSLPQLSCFYFSGFLVHANRYQYLYYYHLLTLYLFVHVTCIIPVQ